MAPNDPNSGAGDSVFVSSSAGAFRSPLSPPAPFNFTPDAWPKWKRRFERYRIASGMDRFDASVQVNTLLYVMGDAADDIFASFLWALPADASDYKKVMEKFEAHFIPRRNIIHERYMFNRRHQLADEASDTFITALYTLSEYCEYEQMRDDLIRDHIVLGIRDADLSKKMQMVADLTLPKAIQMVRTHESVEREGQLQRTEPDSSSIDKVNRKAQKNYPTQKGRQENRESRDHENQQKTSPADECYRCGEESHSRRDCPAARADCHNCGGVGHYSKMCRSKNWRPQRNFRSKPAQRRDRRDRRVRAVGTDSDAESSEGSFYIGRITNCSSIRRIEDEWIFRARVGGSPWNFEIDTGADDTVAPPAYRNKRYPLKPCKKRLIGPDGHPLTVIGMQELPIHYDGVTQVHKIYFVEGQKVPLLGKPAIKAFQLLRRVNSVNKSASPEKQFSDRFRGFGDLKRPYKIVLQDEAKPFAIKVPRKVPFPLLEKMEKALEKEVRLGIITKITEPTDWVAPLVVVPKKDGSVRLCVDYSRLNVWVKREYFPMPNVEETLAQLKGGRVFSKLDANSGFHQIRLAEESKKLTTFLTPFGRFYFNRLPMGITSAPEHFQCQMREILADCKNVACHMDDVLVWGADKSDHDKHLTAVFEKLRAANVTLNAEKCQFRKTSIKFLGHVVSEGAVAVDPDKVKAIADMEPPQDKKELQSLLGMLNFLTRHIPDRSENLEPLYALLRKDVPFHWGNAQDEAFSYIKKTLSAAPVLAIYDKAKPLTVSCDASSYGLGAVLLQMDENQIPHPISFISRTLNKAEQRYAQIEKELLAIAWACDKFDRYLVGLKFNVETDHKPLVPILSSKFLDDLSPRLQRLRMKLLRFNFTVKHTPGKDLTTADLLSRKPIQEVQSSDGLLHRELRASAIGAVKLIPASTKMMSRVREAQRQSRVGQQLLDFIKNGWPTSLPDELAEYARHQASLSTFRGLILYCQRLWIPHSMRAEILRRLHSSHMGQTKMQNLAQVSVWWPGLHKDITTISDTCVHCAEHRPNKSEPLITSPLPSAPWRKVGVDLFKKNEKWYIVVADYYSKYIELSHLSKLTSSHVIQRLEAILARHGVPKLVYTDNGTQLTSNEMYQFAADWDFEIVTRSPSYPQSNGLAEAAVKTAKRALDTSSPNLALLLHRATPTSLGYSPAQLLMNRQIRTTIPAVELSSRIPHKKDVQRSHEKRRHQMEKNFNRSHSATPLPELSPGEEVYIEDIGKKGVIVRKRNEPRSYDIQLSNGTILWRNRRSLRCPKQSTAFDPDLFDLALPHTPSTSTPLRASASPAAPLSKIPKPISPPRYVTRFGRNVKEPTRYEAVGPLRDRSESE